MYDLKAVNPYARRDEDNRTPEELIEFIEQKGREVEAALTELKSLTQATGLDASVID